MSVHVNDRKPVKETLRVETLSLEIHQDLIGLMQRSFGVKDLDNLVRLRYAHGKDSKEDFAWYRMKMHESKRQIDWTVDQLTANIKAANTIHPRSLAECDQRRSYQNAALANCAQLKMKLQKVVETFWVDINIYHRYFSAIDQEIDLIKRWRQSDNKIFRSKFNG